jgi:4-hydroxy-tetrahydrodipicolinate synthase
MPNFSGVIVPMVTPFHRDEKESINYDAAEKLIEKLINEGVSGIFTFGSNGEFYVCTPQERIDFSKFVVEKVSGRVPVYVGTGSCSTVQAVEMSKKAEAIGADAVSVINPFFMKISDEQILKYYENVAKSVKIPIIMYNIPKLTSMNISSEVVSQAANIENVKGIKDSSGDMSNITKYIEATRGKDVDVLVGSDGKISEAYALGASGAVAGTANLITTVVVNLFNSLKKGDLEAAKSYQKDIEPLRNILHMGSTPQTLKRALEFSGIPVGPGRSPLTETTKEVDKKILTMLDHYGISHE